jgi:hypothetical protein
MTLAMVLNRIAQTLSLRIRGSLKPPNLSILLLLLVAELTIIAIVLLVVFAVEGVVARDGTLTET